MGDFASVAMMGLKMVQSGQQAKAQQNASLAQQRADIQQRQYQLQIQERDKRARLKRVQATQRARFGAQGLNPAGGSAAALLAGLRKDTEKSIAEQRSIENMRINRLSEKTQAKARINLLEEQFNPFSKGAGTVFNLLER
jgi:hypothetical protein